VTSRTLLAIIAIAALMLVGSCGKHSPMSPLRATNGPGTLGPTGGGGSPGDSVTPPDPPPPPPPPPTWTGLDVATYFIDSLAAPGQTVTLHVDVISHTSEAALVTYSIRSRDGWAGFPDSGSIAAAPGVVTSRTWDITIPAGTTRGYHTLDGDFSSNGYGSWYRWISVFVEDGSPPPPPSPPPALVASLYVADSLVTRGQHATLTMLLTSHAGTSFDVAYDVASPDGWAGFPLQGSVTLAPEETTTRTLDVTIPADATLGWHRLEGTFEGSGGVGTQTVTAVVRVVATP
jgi:alpha-galactosidase-like protein